MTAKRTVIQEPEGRELLKKLSAPFHPSFITARPGPTNKDNTRTMAMLYADVRAYQKRLDEVCGTRWSMRYVPWGDKRIICELTIDGETRSATGEYGKDSENQENGGTSAEGQAFKRAAAAWGLGRYLYGIGKMWAEFEPNRNGKGGKITPKGMQQIQSFMAEHYNRWVKENGSPDLDEVEEVQDFGLVDEPEEERTNEPADTPAPASEPVRPSASAQKLIDDVYDLAKQYKNKEHDSWLRSQVSKVTKGRTELVGDLGVSDLERILNGIQTLLDKRKQEESDPKA